ncbi:LppM family (lipo)protein [Promicromonospora sp. NPDC052451]|uniref:LppM family (lipo)protein n=1 Tax=Promicromonospora sp. NPDC052451 TaxID=3364407 RepID=UPI0037CAC42B
MTPPRRVGALAALAVLTLTLSGCVRMGVELDLRPGDAASSSVVLAVEDRYLDRTGQSPGDVIDTLTRDQEDPAQDAARTEDFQQDGYTGTRYVYPETGIGTVGAQVGWPITVVREGDDYLVSGTLDLTEEGLGSRGAASVENLSFTVDVTFPGEVRTSNGTADGNTVRWEPAVGETVEIHARGSAVGPEREDPAAASGAAEVVTLPVVPEWMVLVLGLSGLVILLLIGVIVWQAMLRVRDRRPAEGAPAYAQVPGPYGPVAGQHRAGPAPYGAGPAAPTYGAGPAAPAYGAAPPTHGGAPGPHPGASVPYGGAPGHPQEQTTPPDPNRPPSFPPGF